MATAYSDKAPPPFNAKVDDFNKWVRKFNLWASITDLPKAKQGASLVLRLDDDTQDTVLELVSEEDINKDDGTKTIIDKLQEIFKKDPSVTAFELYEELETYKRPPDLTIAKYCWEFEKRLSKVKTSGTTLSEPVLAFRLLKSANLTEHQESLVRATITKIDYKNMVLQLKKVVGSQIHSGIVEVKEENEEIYPNDTYYGGKYSNRKGNNWQNPKEKQRRYYEDDRYYQEQRRQVSYKKDKNNEGNYNQVRPRKLKGRNPLDPYGKITRCRICESINHWENKCPDRIRAERETYHEEQLNSSFHSDHSDEGSISYEIETHNVCLSSEIQDDLTKIVYSCESFSVAILDSGAPKSVCGTVWLSQYIDTLSPEDKLKVKYSPATNVYKFGCGSKSQAIHKVKFPAILGDIDVMLKADVVKGELPLLLSRSCMKQANSELNFKDDTIEILGQTLNLQITRSGHYALPLGRNKQLIVDSNRKPDLSITLHVKNVTTEATALKLHRQFAHPPAQRLIKLVQNKGEECKDLIEAIKEISEKCQICKQYKRPQPRPVVGFPVASTFNECVAMDLKQFGNVHLLHMIDSATRLSAGAVIRSKKPEIIVRELFNHWISIYGTPHSLLSDNGGEFNNKEVRELGEKCNIKIKTTAAESPWSNGLVERHNQVLGDMIMKTRADTGCSLEMAVMWCITAHNSLTDVHGFSPFQLVFGRNPSLPALLNDKPPALDGENISDMIRNNLNVLHASRQAKIRCESDERLRRALSHNIRTSSDTVYIPGDQVYYKRKDTKKWKGPAKVLAKDGQQVLLKHGGVYIRVHPCRLTLCEETNNSKVTTTGNQNVDKKHVLENSSKFTIEEETSIPRPIETDDNPLIEASQQADSEIEDSSDESYEEVQNDININNENSDINNEPHDINNEPSNQTLNNTQQINHQSAHTNQVLKKGVNVRFKVDEKDEWQTAKLTGRAGKISGCYSNAWNVINEQGEEKYVNFGDINIWEVVDKLPDKDIFTAIATVDSSQCEEETELYISETVKNSSKEDVKNAKLRELKSWRENQVYSEVENVNQSCISGRWIIKPKIIDGIQSVKARYVLRGFEETQEFRTDSPTCMRESVRIVLALFPTLKWKINSIDFKTAFLQGRLIERDIYVKPPKEAETNKLWKLNKTAYGLKDAPREWYLRLKNQIVALGCQLSSIDSGLFMKHEKDSLVGLLIVFVDDLLWGGDRTFEATVIKELKQSFTVGCEQSRVFKYIGINLNQADDYSITLNQEAYIKSIHTIPIDTERSTEKTDTITTSERKELRSAVGKLNWISGISRPDIGFSVTDISTSKKANVENMLKTNKVIMHIKNTPTDIKFPVFTSLNDLYIKVYTDASYANCDDKGSMGGHIIFLTDGINCCPIAWQAKKIQRIVRSSTAAETLALVEGCERAYVISRLFAEILTGNNKMHEKPVVCVTDNMNLYQSSHTTNSLEDKRLLLEMNIVRQMISRNEIKLLWCKGELQLSDVLTKIGASGVKLRKIIHNGHF